MYLFQSGGRVGGCVRQLMDKQALRSASTDSEKVRAPFSKVPCLSIDKDASRQTIRHHQIKGR